MILAITQRYERFDNDKYWPEEFYLNKYFKDIFEDLNILLFPVASLTDLEKVATMCDGLLLTGRKIDVNPKLYGEIPVKETFLSDYYKLEDELDFSLIRAFNRLNKPILGICAGIQVINVCFGGSLYQNICNHSTKDDLNIHSIQIAKNSFLEKCYGSDSIEVNSFHHQAIKDVAENFKVTAFSEDGIVEAIEYKNILGVQWHPEQMKDIKFFRKFIELYF